MEREKERKGGRESEGEGSGDEREVGIWGEEEEGP